MTDSKKILLVEGESDKSLFQEILKQLKLDVEVQPCSPKDFKAEKDGKICAKNLLPDLLGDFPSGKRTHLALILDADYTNSDGGGFEQTHKIVREQIKNHGYNTHPITYYTGLVFPHSDGLTPFGLWVMPNNQDDGMCENWIKKILKDNLLHHACDTVDSLKEKRFNAIHTSKAEVATYMAWQKSPPQGNDYIIKNNLIDTQSQDYLNLTGWLRHIFEEPKAET